jgi:Ca2+-binding EF-hand superfamily protein
MGNALRSFGFNVSPKFIHTLIQKFDRYGKRIIESFFIATT